jgi:hypothetical protein
MWHFAESRRAGFLTRRGGFPATREAPISGFGACGIADRVAIHQHARHAVRRRRDKVLVEIETDGKPRRFSILSGDT